MQPELEALAETIGTGEAILFTGAGFSRGMRDRAGRPLPTSEEMAAELWRLVFGDDEPDGSSLADLFDVALVDDRDGVRRYLEDRLQVGDEEPPPHIVAWLAAPWRRIYTLNVDDAEVAVARRGKLPHALRSLSPFDVPGVRAPESGPGEPRVVDVVHLNGIVGRDVAQMTFSTLQYAERLCDRQPSYEQLAEDLERSPFVFVGTTLDEAILWQHVMSRAARGREVRPPRSFLVTQSLTRARALLLEAFGIVWLALSAEDTAAALWRA